MTGSQVHARAVEAIAAHGCPALLPALPQSLYKAAIVSDFSCRTLTAQNGNRQRPHAPGKVPPNSCWKHSELQVSSPAHASGEVQRPPQ